MAKVTIYHNPKCSKSREALALLEARGIAPDVMFYLEMPPNVAELDRLLKLLGKEPRDVMRRQEPEYRELALDSPALTRAQLLEAIVRHPRLLERPIVVANGKAVIGRPPESVLTIL